MKKLLIAAVLVLVGCDAEFRYPCQDPQNWNSESCKPPLCEINRDCPSLIFNGKMPSDKPQLQLDKTLGDTK